MKPGISTGCLYPMETEKALLRMLELGYRRLEIFLNCESELEDGFLLKLRCLADSFDARIDSIHPFTSAIEGMLLFGNYPRRIKEGFDTYERYFHAGAVLGAKYLAIHGDRAGVGTSDEQYCDRFGTLYRMGKKYGVLPLQENVRDHRSSRVDFLKFMREYLKEDCGFLLDMKQLRYMKCDVKTALDAIGDRLFHVHLSDGSLCEPCLLPGSGGEDTELLIKTLRDHGYDGTLITEVYRSNFKDEEELRISRLYMEKLL